MRDRLIVFISALLFIASQANLAVIVGSLHPNILALQLAFTPEAFWRVIELWGASGVALYRAHFQFDNVHPFIYGAFGFLLVSRTSFFSGVRPLFHRAILLLLPIAGLFDLVENAAHIYLLGQPHGLNSVIIPVSATCSLIKWVLASLFAVVATIQVARKLWTTHKT